jgi:hypothetical protein
MLIAVVVSVTIVVITTLLIIAVVGGRANLGLVPNASGSLGAGRSLVLAAGGGLVLAAGARRLQHALAIRGAFSTNLALRRPCPCSFHPRGLAVALITRGELVDALDTWGTAVASKSQTGAQSRM